MSDVLEHLGAWPMILFGGLVLGGIGVLVPMAVIFSLRVAESAITGARDALQALRHRLSDAPPRPIPPWTRPAATQRASAETGRGRMAEGRKKT